LLIKVEGPAKKIRPKTIFEKKEKEGKKKREGEGRAG